MIVDEDIVCRYNENGLYCKEDIIFELLLGLLRKEFGQYDDVEELEDAYRNAYNILPFHIELK